MREVAEIKEEIKSLLPALENVQESDFIYSYTVTYAILKSWENTAITVLGKEGYIDLFLNLALHFLLVYGISDEIISISDENGYGNIGFIAGTSNDGASTSYNIPSSVSDLSYFLTTLQSTPYGRRATLYLKMLQGMPFYNKGC